MKPKDIKTVLIILKGEYDIKFAYPRYVGYLFHKSIIHFWFMGYEIELNQVAVY